MCCLGEICEVSRAPGCGTVSFGRTVWASDNPEEQVFQLTWPEELPRTPRIKPRALQSLRDLAHTHSSNISPCLFPSSTLFLPPGIPAVPQTCQGQFCLRAFATAVPSTWKALPSPKSSHPASQTTLFKNSSSSFSIFFCTFACSLPWLLELAVGWCLPHR